MSGDPTDILIVTLGTGFFVGPRDLSRQGMRFGTHAEAAKWARAIAHGRRIVDKTGVTWHGNTSRTRSRSTRVVHVNTPCGVIALPADGRSVSTSRGRELARRARRR